MALKVSHKKSPPMPTDP